MSATETEEHPERRLPELMRVSVWADPAVEAQGFSVTRSDYAETFWLPVVGPSAFLLARRLAMVMRGAEFMGDDYATVDMPKLAAALGIDTKLHANSTLARSVHRLCRYYVVRRRDFDHLEVRTHVDVVGHRIRDQWPEWLRAQHNVFTRRAS